MKWIDTKDVPSVVRVIAKALRRAERDRDGAVATNDILGRNNQWLSKSIEEQKAANAVLAEMLKDYQELMKERDALRDQVQQLLAEKAQWAKHHTLKRKRR